MTRSRAVFILVFLAATAGRPLQAATMYRLTLEDLVVKADRIVIGRVIESQTFRSKERNLILTRHKVVIQESLKGPSAASVEVTTIGGQMGETVLQVSGMPALNVGEDLLLFLKPSGEYMSVLGWQQGKYSIRNGEVSNTMAGLSFSDGLPGKTVRMSIEAFKRQILERLGK